MYTSGYIGGGVPVVGGPRVISGGSFVGGGLGGGTYAAPLGASVRSVGAAPAVYRSSGLATSGVIRRSSAGVTGGVVRPAYTTSSYVSSGARVISNGVTIQKAAPLKYNYFPLWAKGPAVAFALNFSGLDWEGVFIAPGSTMENLLELWGELKPSTPWGHLPTLDIPNVGQIGHELTILAYIAKRVPSMGGANDVEFCISNQLMQQSEDIYQKLATLQPTVLDKNKDENDVAEFWADADDTKHNRKQGLAVFLGHLERFHAECGNSEGRFTASGVTVGECKLFTTLHALKMISDKVLDHFPALLNFYFRFAEEPKARQIMEDGGNMPGVFAQYFVAPGQ